MGAYTIHDGSGLTDLPDNVRAIIESTDPYNDDELSETPPSVSDEHTHTRDDGEQYAKHEGLVDAAHRDGLRLTYTEPVWIPGPDDDDTRHVFRAVVVTDRGVFTAYGDADKYNAKLVDDALIRMAETRALSRALRQAVNEGATAYEEVRGGDDDPTAEAEVLD